MVPCFARSDCSFALCGQVSWQGAEHGFAHSGENDYTLLMLESGRYLLYR
jgi:hypothetical protein